VCSVKSYSVQSAVCRQRKLSPVWEILTYFYYYYYFYFIWQIKSVLFCCTSEKNIQTASRKSAFLTSKNNLCVQQYVFVRQKKNIRSISVLQWNDRTAPWDRSVVHQARLHYDSGRAHDINVDTIVVVRGEPFGRVRQSSVADGLPISLTLALLLLLLILLLMLAKSTVRLLTHRRPAQGIVDFTPR